MADVESLVVCSQCGAAYEQGEVREFEGDILCEACLDEHTFICTHCSNRFWDDDNHGDSDTPLCENCSGDYYVSCERCSTRIRNDEANYEEEDEDSDYPYCDDCYDKLSRERYLHGYNYKPEPVFYGKGNRYFGVELELDDGGKDNDNAKALTKLAGEHIYIKTDGSLLDGFEIVTHPMSLEYHSSEMQWSELTEMSLSFGYKSHKTSTCGLHIHVNRNSLGINEKEQEAVISRILFIVERFWQELLRFSRRTQSQINQWANRYGYKDNPSEVLDHAKKGYGGRYTAVNITNWQTIEFRLFRGTLKVNTIIATLQLVNELVEVAFLMSDEEVKALDWCGFVERIDKPELITYLKERRLYINEPIESEEDE